jgi:DNA-binding transcriptional ArsR family regulator
MPLSRASVSASSPTSASSSERRDRQGVSSQQSKEEFLQLHAYLCKGLAHPTRLLIIDELRDGPRSVSELVQRLGLRQSNLSQHLGILRDQRVVIARRQGQTVYYSLRDPRVTQAFDLLRQVLRSVLKEGERLAVAN